jgi:hypothetical protein
MKTVKEFKDAGLVFVEGDEFYYEGDRATFLNIVPSGKMFQGQVKVEYPDGGTGVHDVDNLEEDMPVTKFAWRTNTGERPSFKGEVEVELRSGRASRARISGFGWWLDGDDTDIIKWRPVISEERKMEGKANNPRVSERKDIPECNPEIKIISNASDLDGENLIDLDDALEVIGSLEALQQDTKSIYTKEMHEAGELPPVGSKFTVEPNTHLAMKCLYSSKFCVIGLLDSGLECVFDLHRQDVKYGFKPIDERTEEEKIVDSVIDEFNKACPEHRVPKSTLESIVGIMLKVYSAGS